MPTAQQPPPDPGFLAMEADEPATPSGRNLVICLDGTGNQFGRRNTNIVKLIECLEQDDSQLVYYDPGVGTMGDQHALTSIRKSFTRMLGAAIGWGLLENVRQAYDYLASHYRAGDRIFLFGFSRGAYTARALAAVIHMYGLTRPGLGNLTPYVLGMHADPRGDAPDDHEPTPGSAAPARINRWAIASSFKKHLARPTPIEFLGVFDTVSSVGWFWNPLRLPFTEHNPSIRRIRHAVAIAERRAFFQPDLYRARTGGETPKKQARDLREVWFAGVHSDVGGGYSHAEQGLAQIALEWMIRESGRSKEWPGGLRFSEARKRRVLREKYPAPSAGATAHDSLTAPWWPLELVPKFGRRRREDGSWAVHIRINLFRRRTVPAGARIHASAFDHYRLHGAPPNLGPESQYDIER